MSKIERDSMAIMGRIEFGRLTVTAAELLSASGLLTLRPTSGACVILEAGAVLRGIQLLDYEATPELDLTASYTASVPTVTLVCSSAAPWGVSVIDEDGGMANIHKLYIPSASNDGTRSDGVVTNVGQVVTMWRPDLQRWHVPWSAP